MKFISALLFIGISHITWAQNLEDAAKPFIDQLENGDTMTIAIITSGCLHFSTRSIVISKSEAGYMASNDTQSRMLSKKDLKLIRKFETTPKPIGCLAGIDQDVYLLTLGEKTRQKMNDCYDWKPYERLIKKLEFSKSIGFLETL